VGVQFADNTHNGPFGLNMQGSILRSVLTGATTTLTIFPNGNDTWRFNYFLELVFSDSARQGWFWLNNELTEERNTLTFQLALDLDIQVQPCPPPLNQAVSVMVSAKDKATGQPVDGEVIIVSPTDGQRTVERTNAPFTYTFRSKTVRHVDPVTHEVDEETFYPTGSVVAPGYNEAAIDFCFPP
jgi:hypothetical protein